ncbi:glycosyltransferase family 4 protein [Aliiglaciecola sp. SL4]|uniref:glycosyltransferase family 4 protein n=1 Tax=Aliiglaciecola sp. SL4 TaxID=3239806 RepID=UPI00355C5FCC
MTENVDLTKLNVSIVHRRIKHHAQHSGYNTVFEYMKIPHAEGGIRSYIAGHMPAGLKWRLHSLRPQAVGDEGLIPELKALSTVASSKPGICHFIYGEDTYFYTPLWQHKNKKVIATYHYPPVRLDERVNRAIISRLSAVILMSNSQRSWFERYIPKQNIHVIHHHVDTDFFKPDVNSVRADGKLRIVSLGGILRNMDLLEKVVVLLTDTLGSEAVKFDFLIPKSEWPRFDKMVNVNLLSGISDEQLRDVYRNASIGFMPLIDCTANNAVLEMMSTGKAIVCSNVGGISDYLNNEGAVLFEPSSSAEAITAAILDVFNDKQKMEKMQNANRQRAIKHFSLAATAEKLAHLYSQL